MTKAEMLFAAMATIGVLMVIIEKLPKMKKVRSRSLTELQLFLRGPRGRMPSVELRLLCVLASRLP